MQGYSNSCKHTLYGHLSTISGMYPRHQIGSSLPHMRFHDLRHSAATILLQAKVQLKTAQELLGHSTIATTADIYSHVSSEMREEVVNIMDDFFRHE
jgi:integrase